jgi:type II secretory pathway component PulF
MEAPAALPEDPGGTATPSLRRAFVATVWIVFGFVSGVSAFNLRFAVIYEQLQMTELPVPTDALLAASRFLARGAGLALLAVAAGVASYGALQGTWDRRLPLLIFVLLLGALMFASASILGVYLPLFKIQQQLSR